MKKVHFLVSFFILQYLSSATLFSATQTSLFNDVGFVGRNLALHNEMFPNDLKLEKNFYNNKKILFVPGGPSSVKGDLVRSYGVNPDDVVMCDLAYPENDVSVEENVQMLKEAIFSPERDLKFFYSLNNYINWNWIDGAATMFGVRDLPERRKNYTAYTNILKENNKNFLNDYRNHSDWMIKGDITNLPDEVTKNKYDLIVSSNLLHLYSHILDDEFHYRAYEHLVSQLAPGGKLIVFPITNIVGFQHKLLDNLIERLDGLGYTVELVKSDSPNTNEYFKKLLKIKFKTAYYLRVTA